MGQSEMGQSENVSALTVALIAHDQKKPAIVDWVMRNRDDLSRHNLVATGTTGRKIAEACGLDIECCLSGPLGGDAQIGAMIAERRLDVLIFFTDPLSALPHDVDVKALLRLAVLHDIVIAMNPATADAVMSSLRSINDSQRGTAN